jgi:glycosyltransferase involved in cell wall biosynthesis
MQPAATERASEHPEGNIVESPQEPVHPASTARRYGFVMELQAGLQTVYANWRRVVEADCNIDPTWVPISYHDPNGLIERLGFMPASVRAAARSYLQVERGLGSGKYDAVLFNTYNPAVLNQGALRRQPGYLMFDVTPRQYDGMAEWYEHEADRAGWLHNWKDKRVRATFQAAAGHFAWSNWAAASAIEDYGVSPDQVHVLPPGVDTDLWRPLDDSEREAKSQSDVTRVLFVGYAFERKGGDLLLRWARETQLKNWELHLVTMEPQRVPPGVVVHNGMAVNSQALVKLTQRCDVFVLPTRADCFSLASLEAMSVGLPVLTTRVGGIPDIVEDGVTGYLIEPGDYDDMKERLEVLIGSPGLRRSYGNAAREVVCRQFNSSDGIRRGLQVMSGAHSPLPSP